MDDRIDRSATSPLLLFAKLTSRPDGNEPIIKAFYPTDYDEQQLHTIKKYAFPFDQQKENSQNFHTEMLQLLQLPLKWVSNKRF